MRTSVSILGSSRGAVRPPWGFAPWWRFGLGPAPTDPRPSGIDHDRAVR